MKRIKKIVAYQMIIVSIIFGMVWEAVMKKLRFKKMIIYIVLWEIKQN